MDPIPKARVSLPPYMDFGVELVDIRNHYQNFSFTDGRHVRRFIFRFPILRRQPPDQIGKAFDSTWIRW